MQPIIGILVRDAIYTREGVESALGLSEEALREARQAKQLKAVRLGRRMYYRGEDLIRWIETAGTESK